MIEITKGEWKVTIDSYFVGSIVSIAGEITTVDICQFFDKYGYDFENREANAILIADTGNTYQKCGKLPSELLEQNKAYREIIDEILSISNESEGIVGWHQNGEVLKWEAVNAIQLINNLLTKLKQ